MNKKAIVIVLDSVGIGELPDAANYGDKGADTLGHIINTCHPKLPHLMELGLANIDGASFPGRVDAPKGCCGKLRNSRIQFGRVKAVIFLLRNFGSIGLGAGFDKRGNAHFCDLRL